MSDGINIIVDGGTSEERNYVSNVIESSLVNSGFKVDNNILITDEDNQTLLDYAKKANPDLFNQVIEINTISTDEDESDEEEGNDSQESDD